MCKFRLLRSVGVATVSFLFLVQIFYNLPALAEVTNSVDDAERTEKLSDGDSGGANETHISPSKVEVVKSQSANGTREEEAIQGSETQDEVERKSTTAIDSSTETLSPSSHSQNQKNSSELSDHHATKSTLTVTATRIGMTRYFHSDAAQQQQHRVDGMTNETSDENVAQDSNHLQNILNGEANYSAQLQSPSISSIPLISLASSEALSFPDQRRHENENDQAEGEEKGFGNDFYDYEMDSQVTSPYHPSYFNEYGTRDPIADYGLYNQDVEREYGRPTDEQSNESNAATLHSLNNFENEIGQQQMQMESIEAGPVHLHAQDLIYLANETRRVIDYYSDSNNNALYDPRIFAESNTAPTFVEYEHMEGSPELGEQVIESFGDDVAEALPNPVALVSSTLLDRVDNGNLSSTRAPEESQDNGIKLEDDFAEAFRRKRPNRRIRIGNGEDGGLKKRGDKRVRMRIRKVNRANFTSTFDEPFFPVTATGPSGPAFGDRIESEKEELPEKKPPRIKRVRSTTTTTTPAPLPSPSFQKNFLNPGHQSTKLEPVAKGNGKPIELLLPKPTSSVRKLPMTRNEILSSLPTMSSPTVATQLMDTTNAMFIPQQIENPSRSSYTEKYNYVPITTSQPVIASTTKPIKPIKPTKPTNATITESPKEWMQGSHSTDVHHHIQHPDENTGQEETDANLDPKLAPHDRKSWENNYMNLQQNSFYTSSGEEMDSTGVSGSSGSLVDINNHGPGPQSDQNSKTTGSDDIEYEDDNLHELRRIQEAKREQEVSRRKMFAFPTADDYAKFAQGLTVNETPYSLPNRTEHKQIQSSFMSPQPISAVQFSVHPHLTVLTPSHPQSKEYFEKLRPSYRNPPTPEPAPKSAPKDQTSASTHFDRTKFTFNDVRSSEVPPFQVGSVIDDEQVLKYHTEGNDVVRTHHENLEPIVVHHHHHQIVQHPSPATSPVSPVSPPTQEHQTIASTVDDSNANFQSNALSMFDHSMFGNMIGEMTNNPHNPFAGNNFNVLQSHTNLPSYTKSSIQQFHPFPDSNPGTVSPNAQGLDSSSFQTLPPFKHFSESMPVAAPQTVGPTPQNAPSSYYYSTGSLTSGEEKKLMEQASGNNVNGKRGPVAVINAGSDGYQGRLNAAPTITLPMPGLVNVPLPPSDAHGMQQVTPHRHYPPHSHSMATHPDYEPANPPLPNGHQLQFHFDPFLQNAGQFPNSDDQNDQNQNLLSSRPPVENHLDKFHDFNQIAQGAQSNQNSGGRYRQTSEHKYPTTRFQGSRYYGDRDLPQSTHSNNEDFQEENEEQRHFERPPRFQQMPNNNIEDEEENPDFENPFSPRPPKNNNDDDIYDSYDKNPTQENSEGNNEKGKGEPSSPFSDKPYVLMFPSLVPEEAMIPVRPKVHGREIPVISASELNPTVPHKLALDSLGPGMEVVHVHPREQMMNVLASKYHDDMMNKYYESKKKPPPNIYTPYGVLVPMGEIGSSPSSSMRANKFLKKPVADSYKSSSNSKAKSVGHGLGKYKPLGELEAKRNVFDEYTGKTSGENGVRSTVQPAIDLLADKLAVKLSALGYILRHPPNPSSFVNFKQETGHINNELGPSNQNSGLAATQHTSASNNLPASLTNKAVPESISSKGIPKTEFRKYVKELLKEKLQEMLQEIEQSEVREKTQYGVRPTPPTTKQTRRTNQFPILEAQYSNHVPVAVVLPPKGSTHRNKKEAPPTQSKSIGGGILQSIKNFFSFSSSNSQSKDSHNKTGGQPSSKSWFYNSRKELRPVPLPAKHSMPQKNRIPEINSKALVKKSNKADQKQRSSFKEVQQLVQVLLSAGVDEDDDAAEIMSMEALLKGMESKNSFAKTRQRSEEMNYGTNLNTKLNQAVIDDLMTSSSSSQLRKSTSRAGSAFGGGEIRVVKPYAKDEALRKTQRRMTKTIVIPSKWKPLPK